MLSFSLSSADAVFVNVGRKNEKSPLIRSRLEVLYALHCGYSRTEAAQIGGCHINSVTNYIKMYHTGGLDLVRTLNYVGMSHPLKGQFDEVEQAIESGNCSTVSDVQHILKQSFSYDRSIETVRQLLYRLGFKRRKNGMFPGKIKHFDKWLAKQSAFIEKLEDLIQRAENKEITLGFADAAHFVYGKFSSYRWGRKATFTPSGHGRYRINVYGLYNVITNQVYSMYNEGYINADFMIEYFDWLRQKHFTDKKKPLHLVIDNARYQHCKYVTDYAENLNIILEFLPGYSPNLNVIERLWKYLKKEMGKKFCDSKEAFEKELVHLLESLEKDKQQQDLWTLLNPKFQTYENSQILSG